MNKFFLISNTDYRSMEKKNQEFYPEMSEAKLISYTLNDFATEIEMESFLHFMEKNGDELYKKLKNYGLLRQRVNQVWNKGGGFALSSIFEYKDEKAFEKSIEEIKKFLKKT